MAIKTEQSRQGAAVETSHRIATEAVAPLAAPKLDSVLVIEKPGTALRRLPRLAEALRDVDKIRTLVEKATGWELDPSKFRVEVVGEAEFKRRVFQEAANRIGATPSDGPASIMSRLQNGIVAGLQSTMPMAYLPTEGSVLICRSAVSRWPADKVRVGMFHEMVHVAQDHKYPGFLAGISAIGHQMVSKTPEGGLPDSERENAHDTVNARMALVEGLATYHQRRAEKEHFHGSSDPFNVKEILGGTLGLFLPAVRNKLGQYIEGVKAVQTLADKDAGLIDLLFSKPELCDVLLKTRGEVSVRLSPETPKEARERLRQTVHDLAKMNSGGRSLKINLEIPE